MVLAYHFSQPFLAVLRIPKARAQWVILYNRIVPKEQEGLIQLLKNMYSIVRTITYYILYNI